MGCSSKPSYSPVAPKALQILLGTALLHVFAHPVSSTAKPVTAQKCLFQQPFECLEGSSVL